MEEHAEMAADRFVNTLSKLEMEQLKALFEGMDAKGVPLEPHSNRTLNTAGMERVVDQFKDTCTKILHRFLGKTDAEAEAAAAAATAATQSEAAVSSTDAASEQVVAATTVPASSGSSSARYFGSDEKEKEWR